MASAASTQGEPFDPNRHQAVMETQNTEVPAGSVLQVFQPGYMIEDRLIRPAMVVVARGGPKAGKPADNGAAATPPPASDDDFRRRVLDRRQPAKMQA